jgi:predicted 2-oxoglutarate/Fe(II)-dependent dioxygenase YbiX
MSYQSLWYFTNLPKEIIDIVEKDATHTFENQLKESQLYGGDLDKNKRNSKNAWIPTTHWLGGFIWNYVQKANRENFLYDISNIDGENIQFTYYAEGDFYSWHNDAGLMQTYKPFGVRSSNTTQEIVNDFVNIECEYIRKLSVVVQLSDPEDYEGGNLQIMGEDGKSYIAPRQKGSVIVFDSRAQHRVLKVKKGLRKSLVAWVVGPRWR